MKKSNVVAVALLMMSASYLGYSSHAQGAPTEAPGWGGGGGASRRRPMSGH